MKMSTPSTSPAIDLPLDAIRVFCEQHHIRKMMLFGSILREDFRPDSDVDVLVEYEPDHISGLRFIRMQTELSTLFGREVDLLKPGFLSRHFRDQVIQNAQVIYERAR